MSFDSISPIDGRYWPEAKPLAQYFSENAFFKERVRVELAYLGLLVNLRIAPRAKIPKFEASVERIRSIEEERGHDVKAIELYIRDALKKSGAKALAPYVHLGLTSEDTNSLAFALLLNSSMKRVLVPGYSYLALRLAELSGKESDTIMAARTHGRPAVPTTFGKELAVFAVRIAERISFLKRLVPIAKFSGAVGTYASFGLLADLNWPEVLGSFVKGMGVDVARYSTQVAPGERLSDILHGIINLNQLMISLSRDLWQYQAFGFVHFRRPGKVSSSTMPQKENPVDLENAEGQAEVSNALLTFLAYRLQQTRMQRDLSDSVVRRMVGQGLAHSLVSSSRLLSSLSSMIVDRKEMKGDVRAHPEIMAEMAQVKLRAKGDEFGYEKVKASIESGGKLYPEGPGTQYLGLAPKLARGSMQVVRSLIGA